MSVNKYKPHVMVLPEDDANRQIVNGFLLVLSLNDRAIQPLPEAGGWVKVFEDFRSKIQDLHKYPERHLVLLIDFDDRVDDRKREFDHICPADLRDRVYLLGSRYEPEALSKECGYSLEKIGERLGEACAAGEEGLWAHPMLAHNQAELNRLIKNVKPFLFNR